MSDSALALTIDRDDVTVDRTAVELIRTDLRQLFDSACGLVDGPSGAAIDWPPMPVALDDAVSGELCRSVARSGASEAIYEDGTWTALAIPIPLEPRQIVAVVMLRAAGDPAQAPAESRGSGQVVLGSPLAAGHATWDLNVARRIADLYVANTSQRLAAAKLRVENRSLAKQLSASVEKISLVRRLTANLKLTRNDQELTALALDWLAETVPAVSLAALLTPIDQRGPAANQPAAEPVLLSRGVPLVDRRDFENLVQYAGAQATAGAVVFDRQATAAAAWPLRPAREVVLAPICDGEHVFGWIAALNHRRGGDFGPVETDLLGCIAAILAIHRCNTALYRMQSDVMSSVVRALVSAIDAKDPYTRGHSDRVARAAVCLGRELGLDQATLDTIYLAGLLHDVGKIGIDDRVLRKSGPLNDDEFEHIKTHAAIGHRILGEIQQIDGVLPVALHHHEQWSGKGYPCQLRGEEIPLLARIVAVADAFDAMSSDRPYRSGMSDDKVDEIMRRGAGEQWDAEVIAAFFRARPALGAISHSPPEAD